MLTIVSAYTGNDPYPALVATLRASCERFGHPHRIVEIDASNWIRATHLKPDVIIGALIDTHAPVLWCDADTELLRPVDDEWSVCCDWAAYNWHEDPENAGMLPHDPSMVLHSGGVTFWNYTAPAFDVLIRWQRALSRNLDVVDDQVLDAVLNRAGIPIRRRHMPKRFNWMDGQWGPPPADVAILHHYVNRAQA